MKTGPNSRRYIVPAAWALTAVAAYSFGYLTNMVFSDSPSQQAAKLAAAGHGPGTAGFDAAGGTDGASRVGGQFDAAVTQGSLTVGQVTGGIPLEDWLKKVMAQDDPIFRTSQFMKLLETLNNPDDIKAALKVLQAGNGGGGPGGRGGRGGGERFMEASMLLQKLTQIDPKAAIALASEGNGMERGMATSTVVRTWAKSDPDAALAWAKANGAPPAAEGGAAGGPGGGFPGANENWALASVVTQMAKTNLDKALIEASTMEGRMGGRTADAIVGEMIQQKGAAAARDAVNSLPEGEFKNDYIQQLASKLAAEDPKGTAAWASGLAAGDARSRALREVAQEMTRKDPVAAGTFISSLPINADSDGARARYAVDVAAKDQSSAIATVKAITDPERQVRTVGEIAGTMARNNNAAGGQQFIAQSPITEEAKTQLAQMFNPQRGGRGGGANTGGGRRGGGGGGGR